MISLIFIGTGTAALLLVILFKKRINTYYENVPGLSESHAKLYKNVVVFLIPSIFIAAGVILFIASLMDDNYTQVIINMIDSPGVDSRLVLGVLFSLFGVLTFVARLTKYKYKLFAKLAVMEEKYGKTKGNVLHAVSYTVAPIVAGIYLLVKWMMC